MKKVIIISAIVVAAIAVIASALYFLCFREKPDQLKFNGGTILFTESISRLRVRDLGEYLVNSGFFDGSPKTLKLNKSGDKRVDYKYEIYLIVQQGYEKNPAYVNSIEKLAYNLFCDIFDSTSLEIRLCDKEFKTLNLVKCREGYSVFGQRLEFNGSELYYQSVGEYWATKLGNYLVKTKFFNNTPKTTQLTRSIQSYEFKIVVQQGVAEDQNYIDNVSQFAQELSCNVFDDMATEIHLCDDSLKTVRVVQPKPKTNS